MICSENTYEHLLHAYHAHYWVILVNKTDLLPALMEPALSWGRQTIDEEDKYLTLNCAKCGGWEIPNPMIEEKNRIGNHFTKRIWRRLP